VSAPASTGGGLPRILTIMGSGETAPTMVKVHRAVLERLGPPPVPAVLLDTPFGFQENATELAQRVVDYFAESLHTRIDVASAGPGSSGSASPGPLDTGGDPFAGERLVAKLRDARYIFAGPGSPSYALRQWRGTVVPALLTERLLHGGAVTFSSAAALTLGVATVPVYEIYKVGEEPRWLEGLDVLGVTGLSAAVIPHYNNAEGGTHDTRFCYLGERRLSLLEPELPDGAFVLGIDEHTALVLDLDARSGEVFGNGVVTVRAAGRSRTWAAGEVISFDEIAAAADRLRAQTTALLVAPEANAADTPVEADRSQSAGNGPDGSEPAARASGRSAAYERSPLLDAARAREEAFAKAIAARDMDGAVQAILELESEITAWSHDIPSGDAMDRARASLRSLIVELGQAGEEGLRDPREVLGPFVETMLQLRQAARADRRFADADSVRDRLTELGVEVRDTATGSEWFLS
jgi:hypothetical protein